MLHVGYIACNTEFFNGYLFRFRLDLKWTGQVIRENDELHLVFEFMEVGVTWLTAKGCSRRGKLHL